MDPEHTGQERLFFALWPREKVRKQMTECIKTLSRVQEPGRLVNPENLHLTLHFLGNIDIHRIECFIQQAQKLSLPPFELTLSRSGYFQKPKVLWLGCDDIPDALLRLHRELGSRIERCGFTVESRAYSPHVTVSRKMPLPAANQPIEPICWPVDSFVLVKSLTHCSGVEYQVRQRFML